MYLWSIWRVVDILPHKPWRRLGAKPPIVDVNSRKLSLAGSRRRLGGRVRRRGSTNPEPTRAGRKDPQTSENAYIGHMAKPVTWRPPTPLWRRNPPVGFMRPCEPVLVDRPPAGSGWLHEVKHDGSASSSSTISLSWWTSGAGGARISRIGSQGSPRRTWTRSRNSNLCGARPHSPSRARLFVTALPRNATHGQTARPE
jgi:hypothetical protein